MRISVQRRRGGASGYTAISASPGRRAGGQHRPLPQPGRDGGHPVSISSDQNAAGTVAGGSPDEAQLLKDFRETRKPGEVTKSYLGGVRETLKERHFAGASDSEIVRELTAAVDNVVRALFVYAAAEHDRRFNKLNQRLGVLARGGYGRGELNPYSDIDLLFLHDWKPGPYLEIVAEIILHAFWDAGWIVGHAVRNIRECVRMADNDLKEKTAILDSRFLAGDAALGADL